jgi:hypothetical protein
MVWVSPVRPNLEITLAAPDFAEACRPASEPTFTIVPCPARRIAGRTACTSASTPSMLAAITAR